MKRRISLVFLSMLLLFAALLPAVFMAVNLLMLEDSLAQPFSFLAAPPSLRLKRFGCKPAALTSATLSGSTG